MHFLKRNYRRTAAGLGVSVAILLTALVVIWFNQPTPTQAESNFQRAFLQSYPNAHASALNDCRLCHTQGSELNAYGRDFSTHGHSVKAIELLDSDLDGIANLDEINRNTFPGDASSKPDGVTSHPAVETTSQVVAGGVYKLIGWNDLGMHCMSPSYANMSVLPPFNTLWAQLILQGPEPKIITQGVTIEYSIEDNTYSVGKTNFWTYAPALFGVNLAPNMGLKGKGLSGTMDLSGDHFVAEGIPLTPYRDSAAQQVPANWYPYQIAHLVARDAATGQILAETRPVAPVSEEMHCETCHADGMQEGIRTGNVETNILTLHDKEEGTSLMSSRPVLCQKCHADNALGAPGKAGVPNLSLAMHDKHKLESGSGSPTDPQNLNPEMVTQGTNNCYLCHPGPATKCLRDVMYAKGMDCVNCHGDTAAVANPSRRPWIDLPRCESCHDAQYAENPGTLFRNSKGHGGLYCEACHGSPHAILPTNQQNDNLQNIALQGFAGTLKDCKVCHGTNPTGAGPHGLHATTGSPTPVATTMATRTMTPTPAVSQTATRTPTAQGCSTVPVKPKLSSPSNGAVKSDQAVDLHWEKVNCATRYRVTVRMDSTSGTTVVQQDVTSTEFKTPKLKRGHKYYWSVQACNDKGCTKSATWNFSVKTK